MSIEPTILHEGQPAVVKCKILQVKPIGNLDIQLLNGTSQLQGKMLPVQDFNPDNVTKTIQGEFHIMASRYGCTML